MKNQKKKGGCRKFVAVAFVCLLVAGVSQAGSFFPLDARESAVVGASHCLRVSYEDFSSSTKTNTALVMTNLHAFAAKDAVECVGMVLEQAFDTGNTNYTGSCALTVGDSTDADLYLTSTELASDGSEVFFKFGRSDVPSVTVDTNTFAATVSAGVIAQKVYTTDDYVKLTFTPNSQEALSANTSGAVRLYFRVRQGGK